MQRLRWLLLVVIAVGSMAMAAPAVATHSPFHPDCSDLADNDGDGIADYPGDPGCESATDDDETDPPPPPSAKPKCNAGRGNGPELNPPPVDCDPGNSGGNNKGGD